MARPRCQTIRPDEGIFFLYLKVFDVRTIAGKTATMPINFRAIRFREI